MARFCSNCGKEIMGDAQFCVNCGERLSPEEVFDTVNSANSVDSSQKRVAPVSSNSRNNIRHQKKLLKHKSKKWPIVVMIAILLVIGLISSQLEPGSSDNVVNATGFTQEKADGIHTVLKDCGVDYIGSIVHDEGLDNAHFPGELGYRVGNSQIDNIILYTNSEGKVYSVRYANNDLYKDGKVRLVISDFMLTDKEINNYQLQAQKYVKSNLKSPSTAKFPNILEWNIWKKDGFVIIQSYVDSQNGFGAMIRSEFRIKVKDGTAISFIFDGKELIK